VSLGARIPASHLLAAALCAGLALPLAFSVSGPEVPVAAGTLSALALGVRVGRTALLAVAILLAGWWLGSLRLADLDRSELIAEIGRVSNARLVVTGPARSSPFELRVPVHVLRFGASSFDERARLDLPRGRAPPQGAIVETVAEVRRPRGPQEDGFDESAYLRRQGIHVVLSADEYRIGGRRGGLGGVADRLRAFVSRGLAPGVRGERRAVIAGILLGEDEGLDQELRDSFRASGLYHLLRWYKRGHEARRVHQG
jgi:predicted membrane metal-binding protein